MRRALACGVFAAGVLCSQSFYLSDDVTLRKETVELTIDPVRETFGGAVSIEVNMRAPSSRIWINAKNLSIQSASIAQA